MKISVVRPNSLRGASLWAGLAGLLVLQILVGRELRPFRPAIEQMPPPPSALALKALALGDDQFLFRVELSWLQDIGDGGGRLRPLKEFDYRRVADWLRAIDGLDQQSDGVFQLGSKYFGAISDPKTTPTQLPPLIDYFTEAGMADPGRRWHWLVWSATKVQFVIKDRALADKVASALLSLREAPETPRWIALLVPPLLRAVGETDRAAALASDPDMIERRRQANADLRARLREMNVQ